MCNLTKNKEKCVYEDINQDCICCQLAHLQNKFSEFIKETVSMMYTPYECPYYLEE